MSGDRILDDTGLIVSRPGVMGGAPRIAGHRIDVVAIWQFHKAGYDVESIQRQYPQLSTEKIEAAIAFGRARHASGVRPPRTRWMAPASVRAVLRAVKVESRADGTLLVTPEYLTEGMELEPGQAPVGFLDRMAIAEWLEALANRALGTL